MTMTNETRTSSSRLQGLKKVIMSLVSPLGKDLGLALIALENRALVAVLLSLISKDVPALPLHDGLMVPASRKDLAADITREKALEVAGVELPCGGGDRPEDNVLLRPPGPSSWDMT